VETDEIQGTIIRVSTQGKVARQEMDYINQLCESYINTSLERKQQIATNTLEFIESQIAVIVDSLEDVEQQLLTFHISENVVDISQEGKLAYDNLQSLYDQKTSLSLHKNYYEYLKEYIEKKLDPTAIISPILSDAQDQLLVDQVNNLQKLYIEREQLSFAAKENNPGLVQINAQIQSTRMKLLDILDGLIYNNTLANKQIDTQEKMIEQQLMRLPANTQALQNLQRKYDVNNKYYTFLLQRRAEVGIQKASTISNIIVIDTADHNIVKMGEKNLFNYLLALIMGLFIPGAILWLVSKLDHRIKDRSDVEMSTEVPILGVIAHNNLQSSIPVHDQPGSAFAEAFRRIRTNMTYFLRDPDQKIILITSTISGEGKTFIAINLATIIAMNQKKVLLADFDLRRPSMHKTLKLNNQKGISTFLAGQSDFNELISPTFCENLYALPAGPVPPNPAELIETKKMDEIIEKVKNDFDYIILDTPPLAVVTDALVLSRHAAANIFIIRQNFSHREVISLINKYFNTRQIQNMSLLINDIKFSHIIGYSYYYGYGYDYGYSYGYGYKDSYKDYYKETND
jgi:capsular exopolysaccharide synthesis family protein